MYGVRELQLWQRRIFQVKWQAGHGIVGSAFKSSGCWSAIGAQRAGPNLNPITRQFFVFFALHIFLQCAHAQGGLLSVSMFAVRLCHCEYIVGTFCVRGVRLSAYACVTVNVLQDEQARRPLPFVVSEPMRATTAICCARMSLRRAESGGRQCQRCAAICCSFKLVYMLK